MSNQNNFKLLLIRQKNVEKWVISRNCVCVCERERGMKDESCLLSSIPLI